MNTSSPRNGISPERRSITSPKEPAAVCRPAATRPACLAGFLVWTAAASILASPAWDAPPAQQRAGQFWRWHWYERGLTNGNPSYEGRFRVKITDLVNGYDAVQFALDQGTTFWGHMLVDNAAIRVALTNGHPDLVKLGLAEFTATVKAGPLAGREGFTLRLDYPASVASQIASVDYQGWYYGYDDNGNLQRRDWHGYTKAKQSVAWVTAGAGATRLVQWDTSMLPAQKVAAVRAVVRFKADTNLVFLTAATTGIEIPERPSANVVLFARHDLPDHFWSRANQLKTCHLDLDVDPARIEKAELHAVTWTGGAGAVKEYFKLNGVHYPVAEGARHELVYSRLPVEPKNLRLGLNRIELLSDTEHHGIEVIYPGPALMVRYREDSASEGNPSGEVRVTVDTMRVVNTMRGGIGASWHAIEEPIPVSEKPHPIFSNKSHGGSGWGAYPPAEDNAAWAQIDRHARWLGLDWNRVEFEQRIYEPERGQFSWDNPEMRILYQILDWCERNRADVFLQQMWGNVRWNTFPEWRDDPVTRVHSGPLSMEDFGEGLATLVEHLVKTKRYTCIRWLCINNEPNGGWSWWEAPPNRPLPLKPGLAAVRQALDKRGLKIPLSGPDLTGGVPDFDPKKFDFHELLGAYDFHSYDENFDFLSTGQMLRFDRNTAAWTAWAHPQGKPLFMSEFGTMANGWGAAHPGPGSYDSVLKDCELVVRRLNAGVDGFNRWSFINRGDLDGEWQFIETWDRQTGKLLKKYTPHPNTYFGVGLISRFTARHSAVLACRVEGGNLQQWQRVFAAALRSPKGQLTLAVVNDAPAGFDLALDLDGHAKTARFYRYGITEQERDRSDLQIAPQKEFRLSVKEPRLRDRLAPRSLTIYSTYKLAPLDAGVVAE